MAIKPNAYPVFVTNITDAGGGGGGGGGEVEVTNFPTTQAVSGPLTNAQLRATAVPVSGTVAVTGVAQEATLQGVLADLDIVQMILNELNTDFGIPSDPPWTGTGNGTVISILKGIYINTSGG